MYFICSCMFCSPPPCSCLCRGIASATDMIYDEEKTVRLKYPQRRPTTGVGGASENQGPFRLARILHHSRASTYIAEFANSQITMGFTKKCNCKDERSTLLKSTRSSNLLIAGDLCTGGEDSDITMDTPTYAAMKWTNIVASENTATTELLTETNNWIVRITGLKREDK